MDSEPKDSVKPSLSLVDELIDDLDKSNQFDLAALDFSKAFDRVHSSN